MRLRGLGVQPLVWVCWTKTGVLHSRATRLWNWVACFYWLASFWTLCSDLFAHWAYLLKLWVVHLIFFKWNWKYWSIVFFKGSVKIWKSLLWHLLIFQTFCLFFQFFEIRRWISTFLFFLGFKIPKLVLIKLAKIQNGRASLKIFIYVSVQFIS